VLPRGLATRPERTRANDSATFTAQMVRDNLEAVLHSARRTSELAMKMADEAIRRMGEPSIAPR
jgi:hypothetical protein